MNQRREARTPTSLIALVVSMLLVLVAVYWFAVRDDDDAKKKASGSPTSTAVAKTFKQTGIPFTFKYPANFAEVKGPAGFIFIAGIGPYDILDVKRIANEPRPVARIKKSTRESLAARPDLTIVGEGTDQRDGVDMVRFDVDSTVDGKKLHSNLYVFSLGGVTWQFECESEKERATIDAACASALGSFDAL